MLETEIKKLTAAVTRLADVMERSDKLIQRENEHKADDEARKEMQRKRDEAKSQKEETEDTPEVENEQGEYTTDDIKSMALAISRKDRKKQKDIKAKLAEYDARIANDLSGDALQAVGEWLKELKEEVGA